MEQWLAQEVPPGVKVAIVADAPTERHGTNVDALRHPRRLNKVFRAFAAAHPDRVEPARPRPLPLPARAPCNPKVDGGDRCRPDGTHLSAAGAGLVARWMLPQLDALLRR